MTSECTTPFPPRCSSINVLLHGPKDPSPRAGSPGLTCCRRGSHPSCTAVRLPPRPSPHTRPAGLTRWQGGRGQAGSGSGGRGRRRATGGEGVWLATRRARAWRGSRSGGSQRRSRTGSGPSTPCNRGRRRLSQADGGEEEKARGREWGMREEGDMEESMIKADTPDEREGELGRTKGALGGRSAPDQLFTPLSAKMKHSSC